MRLGRIFRAITPPRLNSLCSYRRPANEEAVRPASASFSPFRHSVTEANPLSRIFPFLLWSFQPFRLEAQGFLHAVKTPWSFLQKGRFHSRGKTRRGKEMKIGDILVSQWGYEQTNVSFYEVVKATPKTVELMAIEKETKPTGFMQFDAMPLPGKHQGEKFRRRIDTCSSVPSCRITSCEYAYLWNGKPAHGTCYA